MSDQTNLEETDLESLKVVDLKKRLKDLGLPVSGTKSELIERLHEHLLKESMASSGDAVLSQSDSLSDSATNMEDFSLSSPEKEKETNPTCTPIVFSSESSFAFASASVPLKKRAVVQTSSGVAKVEKKLVINRVSVPTPKFVPVIKCADDSNIIALKEQDDNSEKVDSTKPKEVIQLSKNLSEIERLKLRKEKFVLEQGSEGGVEQSNKITFSSNTTKAPKKLISALPSGNNLELLKKRAERFGENVSGLMKKMEDQQRVLNRKTKFGALGNGVSNPDDQEKKRKRAERFGL